MSSSDNQALLKRQQYDYMAAHDMLYKAYLLEKTNLMYLNDAGVALQEAGHHAKALSYFEKALSVSPTYCDALDNGGKAAFKIGQFEKAYELFQLAYQHEHPKNMNHLRNAAAAAMEIGKYDVAYAHFWEAFDNTGDVENLNDAGRVIEPYDPDKARACYELALKKSPGHVQAQLLLDRLNRFKIGGTMSRPSGPVSLGQGKTIASVHQIQSTASVSVPELTAQPTRFSGQLLTTSSSSSSSSSRSGSGGSSIPTVGIHVSADTVSNTMTLRRLLVTTAIPGFASSYASFHSFGGRFHYDMLVTQPDTLLSLLQLLGDSLNRYDMVMWVHPSAEITPAARDISVHMPSECSVAFVSDAGDKIIILAGARAKVYVDTIVQIGQSRYIDRSPEEWSQLLHHQATTAFKNDMCVLNRSWLADFILPLNDPAQTAPHYQAVALYDFQATEPSMLSFTVGQQMTILSQDSSGWWEADIGGRKGLIPSNYIAVDSTRTSHEEPDTQPAVSSASQQQQQQQQQLFIEDLPDDGLVLRLEKHDR